MTVKEVKKIEQLIFISLISVLSLVSLRAVHSQKQPAIQTFPIGGSNACQSTANSSPDGKLPEIVEINEFVLNEKTVKHPYFIAGQFHPEFNSSPFNPHPMFKGLVKAALDIRLKERIN